MRHQVSHDDSISVLYAARSHLWCLTGVCGGDEGAEAGERRLLAPALLGDLVQRPHVHHLLGADINGVGMSAASDRYGPVYSGKHQTSINPCAGPTGA
jgi:hypothetical protein